VLDARADIHIQPAWAGVGRASDGEVRFTVCLRDPDT
jgi:hypothetical protein